jgi:branched-subunit amino acid transport protein AzlD
MIRNNPDIAAIMVLTLTMAVCPLFPFNVTPGAPEPRVIRITDRLELESARIALLSENTARNIECLKQRLHE